MDAVVNFDFSKDQYFTITGTIHVEEEYGIPAYITVFDENQSWITGVHPDQEGKYEIRISHQVDYLQARTTVQGKDRPGYNLYIVKEGPWTGDARVDFHFGKDSFHKIEGQIMDENGNPMENILIKVEEEISLR